MDRIVKINLSFSEFTLDKKKYYLINFYSFNLKNVSNNDYKSAEYYVVNGDYYNSPLSQDVENIYFISKYKVPLMDEIRINYDISDPSMISNCYFYGYSFNDKISLKANFIESENNIGIETRDEIYDTISEVEATLIREGFFEKYSLSNCRYSLEISGKDEVYIFFEKNNTINVLYSSDLLVWHEFYNIINLSSGEIGGFPETSSSTSGSQINLFFIYNNSNIAYKKLNFSDFDTVDSFKSVNNNQDLSSHIYKNSISNKVKLLYGNYVEEDYSFVNTIEFNENYIYKDVDFSTLVSTNCLKLKSIVNRKGDIYLFIANLYLRTVDIMETNDGQSWSFVHKEFGEPEKHSVSEYTAYSSYWNNFGFSYVHSGSNYLTSSPISFSSEYPLYHSRLSSNGKYITNRPGYIFGDTFLVDDNSYYDNLNQVIFKKINPSSTSLRTTFDIEDSSDRSIFFRKNNLLFFNVYYNIERGLIVIHIDENLLFINEDLMENFVGIEFDQEEFEKFVSIDYKDVENKDINKYLYYTSMAFYRNKLGSTSVPSTVNNDRTANKMNLFSFIDYDKILDNCYDSDAKFACDENFLTKKYSSLIDLLSLRLAGDFSSCDGQFLKNGFLKLFFSTKGGSLMEVVVDTVDKTVVSINNKNID